MLFGGTAGLGLVIVAAVVLVSFSDDRIGGWLQGWDLLAPLVLLGSFGILLLSGLVLWRQLLLKRWACAVACLAIWSIVIPILRAMFISIKEWMLTPQLFVFLILLFGSVPLTMTIALIKGWKGLKPGL